MFENAAGGGDLTAAWFAGAQRATAGRSGARAGHGWSAGGFAHSAGGSEEAAASAGEGKGGAGQGGVQGQQGEPGGPAGAAAEAAAALHGAAATDDGCNVSFVAAAALNLVTRCHSAHQGTPTTHPRYPNAYIVSNPQVTVHAGGLESRWAGDWWLWCVVAHTTVQ